jgi:hypothetical protein
MYIRDYVFKPVHLSVATSSSMHSVLQVLQQPHLLLGKPQAAAIVAFRFRKIFLFMPIVQNGLAYADALRSLLE